MKDPTRLSGPANQTPGANRNPQQQLAMLPSREEISSAYQAALQPRADHAAPPAPPAATPPHAASRRAAIAPVAVAPACRRAAARRRRRRRPQARAWMRTNWPTLMQRAKGFLATGDLMSARLLLERAADSQEVEAALMLAQTYDPDLLGTADVRNIVARAGKGPRLVPEGRAARFSRRPAPACSTAELNFSSHRLGDTMRRLFGLALVAIMMACGLAARADETEYDPAKVSDSLKAIFQFGSAQTKQALNANTVTLITGTIGGTYVQVGADLASVLDDGNKLRVLPIVGRGSVQSVADILFLQGVDLGIVRADTLDYLERKGFAKDIKKQFTYVTKLYNEEMQVIAPKSVQNLKDLEGKTVSVDLPNGGTFVTALTVAERLGMKANFALHRAAHRDGEAEGRPARRRDRGGRQALQVGLDLRQ